MVAGAFATAANIKFYPDAAAVVNGCRPSWCGPNPSVRALQLPGSAPRLRLDLVEFGLGTFEFIVEQPHRIENFTKGR